MLRYRGRRFRCCRSSRTSCEHSAHCMYQKFHCVSMCVCICTKWVLVSEYCVIFFLSKAYSYWIYTIGTADTFRYKLSVLGTVWNVKKRREKNTCAVLMCACLPAACLHAYSSMLKKNTHFSIWYSLSVNVNRNFDECGSRVLCLYIINKILLYVFVFIISLFSSSSSSSPFARTSYSIHLIVFHCIFSVCITIYWCSLQMVRVLVV